MPGVLVFMGETEGPTTCISLMFDDIIGSMYLNTCIDVHVLLVMLLNESMLFGTWAKWNDPSRLETRTKESNMCASVRVVKTPTHNESKEQQLCCL